MNSLTEDQKTRIEENKRRALLLRAQRLQKQSDDNKKQNGSYSKKSSNAIDVNQEKGKITSFFQNNNHVNNVGKNTANLVSHKSKLDASLPSTSSEHVKGSYNNSFSKSNSSKDSSSSRSFSYNSNSVKSTCVLKSHERFEVQMGYSEPHIALFKTMDTKKYDPTERRWSFHINEYKKLYAAMEQLKTDIKVEPIPTTVINMLKQETSTPIPEADYSKVDQKLVDVLLPFQKEGVNFAIHNKGRALIADDMGLGKTLQAIAICSIFREKWPLLIVVPSSVRFTWREQLLCWIPTLDPSDVSVVKSGRDEFADFPVVIISYDLMMRQAERLQQMRYKIVVMDESHLLKNSKAARTKVAVPLLKAANHVILLSGTPALSRPIELYTQVNCVDKRLFPNFMDFAQRYCDAKQQKFGWDFNGSSNLEELQIILEKSVMIRRLKSDVMSQLPSKTREIVVLDPDSIKINKEMKDTHKLVTTVKGEDRKSVIFQYYFQTAEAKIPAIKEYVKDMLQRGEKMLLFGHHRHTLDAIQQLVIKKSIKFIRIDGSTNSDARNKYVNLFQEDPTIQVAILSITSANAGINLTAASLVIFMELFWNPGILQQAEDRTHRIGQKDNVNIKYLIAHNTADDLIWPLVQRKLGVLSKAGLSKASFSIADTTHIKHHDIASFFEKAINENDIQSVDDSFNAEDDTNKDDLEFGSDFDDNAFSDTNSIEVDYPCTKRQKLSD